MCGGEGQNEREIENFKQAPHSVQKANMGLDLMTLRS